MNKRKAKNKERHRVQRWQKQERAICSGTFATIYNGRRIVRKYQSGEFLLGYTYPKLEK